MSSSYIPSSKLPPWGGAEQTAFMRKVYELHCNSMVNSGRKFVGNLDPGQLQTIEGESTALPEVALACKQLLAKAREDLAAQKQKRVTKAVGVRSIGVNCSYRSADWQFKNWIKAFKDRYSSTAADREVAKGGKHGPKAALIVKNAILRSFAAPGFSWHQSGTAIDFTTVENGRQLKPQGSDSEAWKSSWLFAWLRSNAKSFGFENPSHLRHEPWHWQLCTGIEIVSFLGPDEPPACQCETEDCGCQEQE